MRDDVVREKIHKDIQNFCQNNGIKIEPSSVYAPESNGMAEMLVQEHWTSSRVMMIETNLGGSQLNFGMKKYRTPNG